MSKCRETFLCRKRQKNSFAKGAKHQMRNGPVRKMKNKGRDAKKNSRCKKYNLVCVCVCAHVIHMETLLDTIFRSRSIPI